MIGFKVTAEQNFSRVQTAAKDAAFRNLQHAAASIRLTEMESIKLSSSPSSTGSPPHTRRGQLPGAIAFDATAEDAVIGPRASIVGLSAEAHEFGGEFRGQQYPARPFAGPALEQNLDRFASDWAGSIG